VEQSQTLCVDVSVDPTKGPGSGGLAVSVQSVLVVVVAAGLTVLAGRV